MLVAGNFTPGTPAQVERKGISELTKAAPAAAKARSAAQGDPLLGGSEVVHPPPETAGTLLPSRRKLMSSHAAWTATAVQADAED